MAILKSKQRDKLPSEVFGLPKERKYPLNDPAHARNALARASAFATLPEKAEIAAKVHKRYPGIK